MIWTVFIFYRHHISCVDTYKICKGQKTSFAIILENGKNNLRRKWFYNSHPRATEGASSVLSNTPTYFTLRNWNWLTIVANLKTFPSMTHKGKHQIEHRVNITSHINNTFQHMPLCCGVQQSPSISPPHRDGEVLHICFISCIDLISVVKRKPVILLMRTFRWKLRGLEAFSLAIY